MGFAKGDSLETLGYVGGELTCDLTCWFWSESKCKKAPSPVVINEVYRGGDTGELGDWVELANVAGDPVALAGWKLLDADGQPEYVFPAGTAIAYGHHVVEKGPAGFGFGIGKEERLRLYNESGKIVDVVWISSSSWLHGRFPDGTGELTPLSTATPGGPNTLE